MTAKRDEELTQEFTEWMALGIEHDAHVIAWVQASSSRTLEYLRKKAKHAKSNRLPHELAFESAWGVWEKVDELKAERDKVNSWCENSKQSKDERLAELKRIDSAIDELIGKKATEQTSETTETVEQRRSRFMKWHSEEEKIKPRGALQRVYERELKQNPKADRSAIGKDIRKARATAKSQNTANNWTSQLITDGKR